MNSLTVVPDKTLRVGIGHISAGRPSSPSRCPFALAGRDMFPGKTVVVIPAGTFGGEFRSSAAMMVFTPTTINDVRDRYHLWEVRDGFAAIHRYDTTGQMDPAEYHMIYRGERSNAF